MGKVIQLNATERRIVRWLRSLRTPSDYFRIGELALFAAQVAKLIEEGKHREEPRP